MKEVGKYNGNPVYYSNSFGYYYMKNGFIPCSIDKIYVSMNEPNQILN